MIMVLSIGVVHAANGLPPKVRVRANTVPHFRSPDSRYARFWERVRHNMLRAINANLKYIMGDAISAVAEQDDGVDVRADVNTPAQA